MAPGVALTIIRRAEAVTLVQRFAKFLRDTQKHDKIGSVGYCWGGMPSLSLGQTDPPLVECCAQAHAGRWQTPPSKDAEDLKVPTLFMFAHEDRSISNVDRAGIMEVAEKRNAEEKTKG
ncbi:hypothetical protein HDU93_008095, partial [Gonapodya sp. JEL0774]